MVEDSKSKPVTIQRTSHEMFHMRKHSTATCKFETLSKAWHSAVFRLMSALMSNALKDERSEFSTPQLSMPIMFDWWKEFQNGSSLVDPVEARWSRDKSDPHIMENETGRNKERLCGFVCHDIKFLYFFKWKIKLIE